MFATARSIFVFLSAALLALLTFSLAWPATRASLIYLPAERTLEAYWAGETLSPKQIADAQNRTQSALAIQPHPRFYNGLSLLHYIEAINSELPLYARREAFEQSVAQARLSLESAPVQPDTWLRVAHAENWLSFSPQGPVDAFKMSVLTSRVEPTLLISRLILGMSRINALDEEGLNLLRDQALLAWKLRQGEFVRALKRERLNRAQLVYLLAQTHPDVLAELEASLGPAR